MTLLVGSPRWLHHGVVILLVAWTSHRFVQSWSERDLSSFEGTRLYAEALVSASPHDSVLLLENSMDYFALVGFQAVHRQRMDLVPVFIPTLSRRWARERLVSRIGSVEFGDLERLADSVQSQGRSVLYGPGDRFRMSRDVLSVRGPLYGWKDMEPLTRRAEMALERFVEGGLGSNDLWYRRRVSIVMGRRAEHESVAGNLASAITDQKVAAEAMPLDGRLHYNLAVLLERASRWEDAVAAYQVALGLDPTRANREGLARSLLGSGQVEAGIHMFRALVDAHGDDAVLRYKLGTALLQAGRFGEAANELRLSVDQAPDQVLAWNNLGLALLAGGGREEARHTWEEALRRFPAHVGLQRNILGLEGE